MNDKTSMLNEASHPMVIENAVAKVTKKMSGLLTGFPLDIRIFH